MDFNIDWILDAVFGFFDSAFQKGWMLLFLIGMVLVIGVILWLK